MLQRSTSRTTWKNFEYAKPNVDFKLGYIENLKEAGIEDESCDVIM